MKAKVNLLKTVTLLFALAPSTFAAVLYVVVNNPNPLPPYEDWTMAATVIQDAVDLAAAGDEVVVMDGVYATGGRAVYGTMTNRVAVDRPLLLRSLNGPEGTVIQGYQLVGTTTGDGAIRCVSLTSGAVLSGFTLTNGATRTSGNINEEQSGGGIWCESKDAIATNCVLIGNSAWNGGGACFGTLTDCRLIRNSAQYGGGAYSVGLNHCALRTNSGSLYGGGAYSGGLNDCKLDGNLSFSGGGVAYSALTNCALTGNQAGTGGGAHASTLINCTVTVNTAGSGGGAYDCTLANCAITGNSAQQGAGIFSGLLNNCTLTGNSAVASGGGATSATLNNCLVYYNTAFSNVNHYASTLNYCCTFPLPAAGTGNIDSEPQLAGSSHLSATSPCRGAGNASYASETDIDGEVWLSPPSIGCDEYQVGFLTGPLTVATHASQTNVAVGFAVDFAADAEGRTVGSEWDFGDGTLATNRIYIRHTWDVAGDYPVVLRVRNESHPEGVSATNVIRVLAAVYYVSASGTNPVRPYASWATAATNIQAAVDAATVPGAVILVTNGIYTTGGRVAFGTMFNRVAVTKPLIVRSANGPEVTMIQGYQVPEKTNGLGAIRCVYLTNGTFLRGFTLTNGATQATGDYTREQSGGGVWCESTNAIITGCTLTGNSASDSGGGAYSGTLYDCTLVGNSARDGGGASSGILNDCTLTGNAASMTGGGTDWAILSNCVLRANSASLGGGAYAGVLNHCTLTENSVAGTFPSGGGASGNPRMTNCIVAGNSSAGEGGGVTGGTLDHCILTGNSGVEGGGAIYASLRFCTIATNFASWRGGGISAGRADNCSLFGNTATGDGGGSYTTALNNCVIVGNTASRNGGGVCYNRVWNCTLLENSALVSGGGAYSAQLSNCILWYNTCLGAADNYFSSTLKYCCTTPLPTNGFGNIIVEPLFIDRPNRNLRLQSNSPCINAGANSCALVATDLDGNARIVSGTADIGAYEYQGPGSVVSYAWLQQYGLPLDGSADFADPDGDGRNNLQESRCWTDPTNALSALELLAPSAVGIDVTVRWQSVPGVTYFLERSTNFGRTPQFTILASNIVAHTDDTTYTDRKLPGLSRLYRVGVAPP